MNVIPSNQQSVFAPLSRLSTLDRGSIIRPLNPPPGIAGFLFDVVEEDSFELESDITDHYVEDNSAMQDHITLKPEKVTVRGFIGELVQASPPSDFVAKKYDPLEMNPDLIPEFTPVQITDRASESAQLEEDAGTEYLGSSPSLYSKFSSEVKLGNKQADAFAYFYQLWKGRMLFTVETPWGFLTDMAIQSLKAIQGPESKRVTEFAITFKKMRFAGTVYLQAGQLAGRLVPSVAKATNTGVAGTEKSSLSYSEWGEEHDKTKQARPSYGQFKVQTVDEAIAELRSLNR